MKGGELTSNRESGPVIEPQNWGILCEMILAARERDIARFHASALRLEHEVPVDDKATRYVTYLLWRQVEDALGRQPVEHDFEDVAVRAHDNASHILKASVADLEAVIRTVFGRSVEDYRIRAGDFILIGSAIVGSLMVNPKTDLSEIYSELTDWYKEEYPSSG
ncbi:hypothetical protein [Amycolatopsis sp. GM8]|uniref:hypothetical protein n=1 Tax=Amycolatopsis sp. GM8 TaxID=2896530 RepID=UPI001F35F942|nr:hypothetical protein [Amycolatopsis sp. GM8]